MSKRISFNELYISFRGGDGSDFHNSKLIAAAIHNAGEVIAAEIAETNAILRTFTKVPGPASSLKLTLGKPKPQ
jgi:hypothetical protein